MTPGPTPATLPLSRSMQGSGLCSETLQLPYLMMPRNSMSITNTKGLLNMPGQNNCFLNSAVQVLWHLDIFRRSFRELSGHACMAESCIFCALKELFAQFQYSQESALPPDALRRALAETFCDQRRFQLGFMDDAAECFENILMRIHFHIANQESEDMCSVSHCIPHQKFAMTLVEQTVCHSCGATSEPLPFTQMVHYVPSSALCSQAKSMKGKSNEIPGFGELLRRAGGLGDLRDCPSSCGAVIQIRKTLMNRPEIVSVGLVWDSERPTIEHIMDVFSTIGLTLKLQDVFHSVVDSRWAASATHQLVGIVTYYGKHYSTFFFHTKLRVWIYFDDAAVREIGPNWEQVVEKCCRGHFQPLLLLYANPYGMSVCTSTAPRSVTTVHSHKKSSSGKSLFGISLSAEKQGRNHLPANCQRRALTPNPEVSYDFTANVQPRRAVTPSAEISMIEDINDNRSSNQNCEASCDSGTAQLVPPTISNVNSTVQSQMQSWDSPISHNSHEQRSSKHNELKNCKSVASVPENSNISFPVSRTLSLNPDACRSSRSTESNQSDQRFFTPNKKSLTSRPASVDDLLSTSALSGLVGSEYSNYLTNGMSEDNICSFDGKNISCQDGHDIENSYINRKTVENVLHLQKLQRQKSMNVKHGHAGVSQRNSSSSLESLDNVFLLKDKGVSNFLGLKLDLPDIHNVARRRDSGNWSGDRNSASSSSTTSLDNPYCYLVGNRSRQYCNSNNMRNLGRTCAPEPTSFTDPGYDSFSLSSSDSYPSTITNSPVKLDPRLVQIPENMQTAFLQSDFSRLQFLSKDPVNGSISCGLKDDCEKLCIEADIFLAKSVERENVGDISMAALLSDTAAAKARAAMDAPYSNTQSVALAKLKHSMCVIRSSSLHKKLKEAEAVQRRKQKESALITQHSHQTQHSGMPISEFNKKENSEKTMTSITCEQNKNQSNDVTEIDEYENTGKSIEIYATLPKKTLKKKGALLSFVESLTGEENSTEKGSKQKPSNISNETVPENGISIHSESSGSSVNQSPGHKIKRNDSTPSKSPSIKKKPRSQQKIYNRDSDLSDYSSEWEHTKKSSLYRTYSGPPSDTKLEFGELSKENLHQTFSGHPTKKQHKIRRKLMGGFMKRKNRSLPDLREGQDQASAVSRSFDDCVIAQTPISLRKQEVRDMKNSSLSFRDSQLATVSPTTSGKFQVKTTAPCAKSNEIKRPITYTQSFAPLPKTSPMKHVARTQTPPPYRPPPPIVDTNLRSLSPKRNVSQNEETKKSITHQTHLLSAKDVTGCTSVDKQKKQLSFIGRKIVPQPSIAENNCSLNNSCESNIQYIKYSYDNEIPKGSAVWLKELQLKQEELIQKRKLQEDKEKFQKDNSYMLQHKLACVVPRNIEANNSSNHSFQQTQGTGDCKQCNIKSEEEPDSHRIGEQNNSQSTTCEGPESPKSVKDLASKFEKILKPCLQLAEGLPGTSDNLLQNVVEKSVSPSNSSSQLEVTLSCSVPSVETKVTEMCGAKENKENASTDSSKQQYPVSSTTGFIYNPHLTEGQLTNMLRIGTNRAAFRNPNIMIANKDNYSAFTPYTTSHGFDFHSRSELRRPDKPPDYETALQRLELIRNDKKILCYFGNNGFVNAEGSISLFEQTKKKRGPKKSVTFSDKVVLVACAGDEDNDFIPNPLLERVYKQHLMQKSSAIHPSDAKNSEGQNMPLTLPKECSKPLTQSNCTDGSAKGFNASASQTSCHLCHKKTVTPPTVYCPDCAFYMSRFQQK